MGNKRYTIKQFCKKNDFSVGKALDHFLKVATISSSDEKKLSEIIKNHKDFVAYCGLCDRRLTCEETTATMYGISCVYCVRAGRK